jgi:PPOX class probable F420-dependent enzyme
MSDLQSKLTATTSNAMTPAEIQAFLRGRRNAYLGTIRSDGFPQVTPVWYWPEDGNIYFSLGESRRHLHNLRANPSATILVDEDLRLTQGWQAVARGVMFCGPTEIIDDQATLGVYEEKMATQYLGDEADDPEFAAAVDSERRYLVVLRPEKTLSWDYSKA